MPSIRRLLMCGSLFGLLKGTVLPAVCLALFCHSILANEPQDQQVQNRASEIEIANDSSREDWQKAVDYLERLGLTERKVQLFEQQLRTNPDAAERRQVAAELAEIYTGRILAGSDDEQLMSQWQEKSTNLLALYPDLDSPALRVAVFHSRFTKFNFDFDRWWSEGREPRMRQELQQSLQRLIRDVVQSRTRTLAKINTLIENKQLQGGESQQFSVLIEQNENALLHTGFVLGWSKFYEAIFAEEDREPLLVASEKYFREVIQIDLGKPLTDLSAEWFAASSTWVRRATLGMALGNQWRGQEEIAEHLFDLLLSLGEPRSFIDSWRLKSLILTERGAVLMDELASALKSPTAGQRPSDVGQPSSAQRSTWAVAARYIPGLTDPEVRRAAELMVLQGLARTRQGKLLLKTVYSMGEAKEIGDPFLKNWIQGYVAFVSAESADNPDRASREFEMAKFKLQRALEFSDDASIDSCVCEFLLAQLDIRDSDFSTAEQRLTRVQSAKLIDPELAGQAAWLRVQTLVRVADRDPNGTSKALLAIEYLQTEFQNSPYYSASQFQKLKLESRSIPDRQALKRFQQVSAQNENYPLALFELVRLQFQIWLREFSSKSELESGAYQRLQDWELRHRQNQSATPARKLKALLFVIDADIRRRNQWVVNLPDGSDADETKANRKALESRLAMLFESAERIVAGDASELESGAIELLYYRFLAARDVDVDPASQLATQLVEQGSEPKFLRPALIFLAQQFDANFASQKQTDPQRGVELYGKLLASFESGEVEGAGRNVEIARGKLARYQLEAKNWAAASLLYSRLVAKSPKRVDYLGGLARAKMELGEFDASANVWRTIIAGSMAGTEVWLEAKHGLGICLSATDPENALRLVRQTQSLYPNMPKHWLERFDLIKMRLEK